MKFSVSAVSFLLFAVRALGVPTNITERSTTGEGGYINLINASPYTWTLGDTHQYQMTGWSWPSSVAPYSSPRVYVEFQTGCFPCFGFDSGDDGGEATYTLSGTSQSFTIQARVNSGSNTLQVLLESMSTQNNAQGSTVSLGWVHNGDVNWVLGAAPGGALVSSNPPAGWLSANLDALSGVPLGQVALPGSHDSGMSALTGGTVGAQACNTITQTGGIAAQLAAGARYFDIRPIITDGNVGTGHYSDISQINSWQGGNGQSMSSIISDINGFTASNAEVIILNLSHDLDTDLGNSNYAPFTQAQYESLMAELLGLNNLLTAARLPSGADPSNVDLTTLTLGQLIGGGQAAVIVVTQPASSSIDISQFVGQGFFAYAQYNAYNSYSDTEDLGTMTSDQIAKMNAQAGSLFLLSWTLTQDATDAVDCVVGGTSILSLAQTADQALYNTLLPATSPSVYPKIVYVDKFDSADIVPLSLGMTFRALAA